MTLLLFIAMGLLLLATISGMLGLGVAFAAVPFLSLFFDDLINQVQPLTLLLNGLTAAFAAFGFARSGFVQWRQVWLFAIIATVAAPLGSYVSRFVPTTVLWIIYGACVVVLLYVLFGPQPARAGDGVNMPLALLVAAVSTALASMLGVGPGFLLVPGLIALGFNAKSAAATNAVAATPASFAALLPRLPTANFGDPTWTVTLLVVGAAGAFLGARISSVYVSERWLKLIFGAIVIIMTVYKFSTFV